MTGEEVAAALDAQSRQLLKSRNLPVSDAILELLNKAKMEAFTFGTNTVLSMIKGALLVHLARIGKSKESGK